MALISNNFISLALALLLLPACGRSGSSKDAPTAPNKGTRTNSTTSTQTASATTPTLSPSEADGSDMDPSDDASGNDLDEEDAASISREACRAKGDEWIFSARSGCLQKPIISAEGALEQTLHIGEDFAEITLKEKAGRTLTWSLRNASYTDQRAFRIKRGVLDLDTTSFLPERYGYPKTLTVFVTGSIDGLRSNELEIKVTLKQTPEQECSTYLPRDTWVYAEGACRMRPSTRAFLASSDSLTKQSLGRGDATQVDLDLVSRAAQEPDDYVVTDETCPGVFDVRRRDSSDRYFYLTLTAMTTSSTPLGACEGKLRARSHGVVANDFLPVKVTVEDGMRFYGYCVATDAPSGITKMVEAVKQAFDNRDCLSATRRLKGTTELWLSGGDGSELDGAPLAGIPLTVLSIKNAALANLPALPNLQKLQLIDVAAADLLGLESSPLQSLTIAGARFGAPDRARTAIERIATLKLLRLGLVPEWGLSRCHAQGSGLAGLPQLGGLPALERADLCEPGSYDVSVKPQEGTTLALRDLNILGASLGQLEISGLPNLETLTLDGSSVQSAKLAALPSLKSISVNMQAGGLGLVDLAGLDSIETLRLQLPRGAHPVGLATLPNLKTLRLSGGPASPETLDDLAAAAAAGTKLTSLSLEVDESWTAAPASFARFGDLSGLTSLRITATEQTSLATLAIPASAVEVSIRGGRDLAPLTIAGQNVVSFALFGTSLREPTTATALIAALVANGRMPALETLTLADLGLEAGDISLDAAQLASLESLNIAGNPIASSGWLAAFKNLKSLLISRTAISDLTGLASLEGLEFLSLSNGTGMQLVTDVTPLASLTKLKSLSLDSQGVTSLAPLASLGELTMLSFDASPIERTEAACPIVHGPTVLKQNCYMYLYGNLPRYEVRN
jgi:Leucine-rich repeat (LRR) protein